MPKTSYQISLKGYVGGYDFDRSTVDKELAKNEGKQVNVLIDSLGGSLCGLWIDLSSFNDYDEFISFCKAIHADEEDSELMAQAYEGFPRQWYNEEFMSEDDYMEFHDELDNFEVIA